MEQLKFSKYNLLCQDENNEYLVYNTLTDHVQTLDEKDYLLFRNNNGERLCGIESAAKIEGWSAAGFVVDEGYEEWRKVEYEYGNIAYGDEELQLTILTTNACNFDCIYCYQKHLNSFMDSEGKEKILKYIGGKLKRNYKKLYVSWFGGEPLLTKKLIIEMSKEMKRMARENKVAYYSQMTTNGYELDLDTFTELIEANVLSYSITLDGVKEIHNKQRPHKNDNDSYETIMRNLTDISKNVTTGRFSIDVRVNLSLQGVEHFFEFANEFKKLFGNDKRFHLVPEPVKDWAGPRIDLVKDRVLTNAGVIYSLYEQLENMKADVTNFYNFQRISHICVAPLKNGYILDWNGNVHKCGMDVFRDEFYEKNVIGKIDNYGKMEINEHKELGLITRDIEKYHCMDCVLYPKCLGIHCVHATRIVNSPECPFYDELYEFAAMSAKLKTLRMRRKEK